ncbi:MAG: hypothetical protein ACJ77M_04620 [Thermoleophilaceae bacterium]
MAITTPPDRRASTAPAAIADAPLTGVVPRLADGVELIGEFEGSGFKEPPYIARRADGQVVQMPPLLYAVAEEIDGDRSLEEIGERVSHRARRGVTGEMVEMLVEERLAPLGVVAPRDGTAPAQLKKSDPLLALRLRTKVVPEHVVGALTRIFEPLFHTPVVALLIAAFAALDVWLFGIHGISQSIRHVLYEPALLLGLLGAVVAATAFHEIGHATACRYGGAKPGAMGVGIYIVWPAFYTDITDAYRLGKAGRLRTDLGGMYFNAIFALATAAAYFATGFEPLLLLVVLQTFAIVQQSMPFLRLDGYYILSDLTGVPDILARIKPVLASLVPGRAPDRRVAELKPWVRLVVTGYLMVLVPVIAFMFLMMVIHAPRVFATAYDSFFVHWDRVGPDFSAGQAALGAIDVVQMSALVLPALGMTYTVSRVSRRAGLASWRWSAGDPMRRGAVIAAAGTLAGFAIFVWWPHGEYRPIQPGERGTILGGIESIGKLPTGRAALTPERAQQLGGAPTQRALQQKRRQLEIQRWKQTPPARRHGRSPSTDLSWEQLTWPSDGAQGYGPSSGGTTTTTGASPTAAGAPSSTDSQTNQPRASTATPPPPSTATTPTDTTPTNTDTTPTSTDTTPTDTTPTDTTPTNTDTTPTNTDTTPTNTDTTSTTPTP